ncbi:MAG: ABC transporter ATP-binding protein [Phycisphaeraceae bacterium]|nr:MAG: ABC transporter ATP-binding protein [Phycisphaeraceae bacterium]
MSGVRKTFGKNVAVEGIDLSVPEGGLVGFIGPNGAGKSTTIRMIMSILFPDTGTLSVLGKKSAVESKDRIGYLPEERGVYKKMKVGAFLRYMGKLKGLSGPSLGARADEWLERVDLADVRAKKCEELSKGMQQKIQFIGSVLHEPDLLILDEPFSGLDPVNMRLLRDLIREQHEQGRTVIFSTHVMVQAEQLCDHIMMIHDGKKVLDDSLGTIRSRYEPRIVRFEPIDASGNGSAHAAVGSLTEIDRVTVTDGHTEAHLAEGADPGRAIAAMTAALPMARVELHRPSLEDIFIDIVQGSAADAAERERLRAQLRHDGAPASEDAEVAS